MDDFGGVQPRLYVSVCTLACTCAEVDLSMLALVSLLRDVSFGCLKGCAVNLRNGVNSSDNSRIDVIFWSCCIASGFGISALGHGPDTPAHSFLVGVLCFKPRVQALQHAAALHQIKATVPFCRRTG